MPFNRYNSYLRRIVWDLVGSFQYGRLSLTSGFTFWAQLLHPVLFRDPWSGGILYFVWSIITSVVTEIIDFERWADLIPGSHESHKHKDKIKTKTKLHISLGTCTDKTTRIFLCFVFCSALGLCLDNDLMLMNHDYDDTYVKGLTSFLWFALCFVLMLMLTLTWLQWS